MNCLKCGRETQEDNVFCQACLLEMQKYPVHADTVVLLPRRKDAPVIKKGTEASCSNPGGTAEAVSKKGIHSDCTAGGVHRCHYTDAETHHTLYQGRAF